MIINVIDDVTKLHDVPRPEAELAPFLGSKDYSAIADQPTMQLSQFTSSNEEVLEGLFGAGRSIQHVPYFYRGYLLVDAELRPQPFLFEAALTLYKSRLCPRGCVNVLPYFYGEQQYALRELVKEIIPDFSLQVILYDFERFWDMEERY